MAERRLGKMKMKNPRRSETIALLTIPACVEKSVGFPKGRSFPS